jgi:HD superfamily phosphodiesterase
MKDIRDLFHSFVAVMTKAIDERSHYNNNHTQNVVRCCERFVRHLTNIFSPGHKYYFTKGRIDELKIAAMLHDIGKIITPLGVMDKAHRLGFNLDVVLYRFDIKKFQIENDWLAGRTTDEEYNHEKNKINEALELVKHVNTASFLTPDYLESVQKLKEIDYVNRSGESERLLDDGCIEALSITKGTLTKKEREIMQDHVALTGRFLDKIASWKFYENVPNWARNHHEYLDGTGYPLGLKEEQISVETRIITIMDIFEALTASDRPYKKAVPTDYALKILSRMADEGKLDKELVMLHEESKLWEQPLGEG